MYLEGEWVKKEKVHLKLETKNKNEPQKKKRRVKLNQKFYINIMSYIILKPFAKKIHKNCVEDLIITWHYK